MDSVFLDEGDRATFIQHMLQFFDCTYICLWSYNPPPSNYLTYKDGFYHERSDQPSSSTGSFARRLFTWYRQSIIMVDTGHIPGLAFQNNSPLMEFQSAELHIRASTEMQRQFYAEAGIKTAFFMGCNLGEIEIGFSDTQVNMEMQMRTWFPEHFSRQIPPTIDLPQPSSDQNRAASSSSPLRSFSYDSPEYSSLLFHNPSTFVGVPEQRQEAMIIRPSFRSAPAVSTAAAISTSTTTALQQAVQALSQIRNMDLPAIESEDAAMTQAILAVLSSPASSSSSSLQSQQNLPPNYPVSTQSRAASSAFRWYRSSGLAPRVRPPISSRMRRENMLKRSIAFLRSLNTMRLQEQMQISRTNLHHMIRERRRREKINESFEALRALLPSATKKDKASILTSTTEYLSSLTAQVEELIKRNRILEEQLLPKKAAKEGSSDASSNERVEVRIANVAESTSAARIVDLQVVLRGGEVSMADLVVSLLEFLKTDQNVSLISVEGNTSIAETTSINNVVLLRLRIEDGEWDESAFQEAIRRVVNDFAQ